MRSKKRCTALVLSAILFNVSLVSVSASEADMVILENDGQFAMFDRSDFPRPGKLPSSLEEAQQFAFKGNAGWANTYYAEGTGLELSITNVEYSDSVYVATLYDYSQGEYPLYDYGEIVITRGFNGMEMTQVDDDTLQGTYFSLKKEGDQIRMEVFDNYPARIYRDAYSVSYNENNEAVVTLNSREHSSILFTDIITLLENPAEDRWGGSWGFSELNENPASDGYESYVCMKQIYGTTDYYSAERTRVGYSEMSDWYVTMFESDSEKLYSYYGGPGEVHPESIYLYFRINANGELMRWDYPIQESMLDYDEDDGPYYHYTYLTDKMMWEL